MVIDDRARRVRRPRELDGEGVRLPASVPEPSPSLEINRTTRKLVKPRWETPEPRGVTGSYGPAVRKWAERRIGVTFDPWQAYAIDQALRHDRNGDIIARIILLSTARQNGKSVIVRAIVGWFLEEGQFLPPFRAWSSMLAAAHDANQARVVYRNVWLDFLALELPADFRVTEWRGIRGGHVLFDTVTGQPGSARGWSAGAIFWDEMLTQKDWNMWEALAPTQSAQRSPVMLLTSTAGHFDSAVLRAFYDRLVRISTGDEKPDPTFYGAWWQSEDPDVGLDWPQIKRANPSLGGRLTKQAIITEHAILPADSWRRERLNHFVDVKADAAFNPGVWAACRSPSPLDGLSGPYALAVDVQSGWERATISVSGIRTDGRVGVEVLRDIRATPIAPVTAQRIISELEAFPEYVAVILYDGISGVAPELRRRGEETGLPYRELKRNEFVSACMDVTELIHSARLAVDDPLYDAQMPMVARRNVGSDGAFCFSRGDSLGPIDAFLSMTFAAHGIKSMAMVPQIHG